MIIRKDTTKARRADKTTGTPACGLLPLWGFGGTIADNHFIFFLKSATNNDADKFCSSLLHQTIVLPVQT